MAAGFGVDWPGGTWALMALMGAWLALMAGTVGGLRRVRDRAAIERVEA